MTDTSNAERDSISSRQGTAQGHRSDVQKADPLGDQMGYPFGSLCGALQCDLFEHGISVEGVDPGTVGPKGCALILQDSTKLNQLRSEGAGKTRDKVTR